MQLEDCEIKQARRGIKVLKGYTTISESQKTFDVASIDFEDDCPCTVGLSDLNVFDMVSVHVKILTVMDQVSVTGGNQVHVSLVLQVAVLISAFLHVPFIPRFVTGVIAHERLYAFERVLWRACRGNEDP